MDRQQMLRDGAREMLDIILFFGLETKGQIRASVDGMTRKLLDNWEPLIRADERGHSLDTLLAANVRHVQFMADLRARVEALPQDGGGRVWRADVLALFDGAQS